MKKREEKKENLPCHLSLSMALRDLVWVNGMIVVVVDGTAQIWHGWMAEVDRTG